MLLYKKPSYLKAWPSPASKGDTRCQGFVVWGKLIKKKTVAEGKIANPKHHHPLQLGIPVVLDNLAFSRY